MATVAATGGSSHSSREARRRRIIERGSDRLALITGRIQSLPPDPEPDLRQSNSSTFTPLQTPAESAQQEDVALISSLPNQESSREQQHGFDEIVEPIPHNSNEDGGRITSRAVALHDTKEESSRILPSMQSPPQDHQLEQRSRSHQKIHNSLTPGQIRSAIAGSENIRLCCSVAAAILVILSYIGFPFLGLRYIRGIMMFRPVYLLLITNISVVIGRVILGAQGVELRRKSIIGGNSSVDQLAKALDLASLMQSTVTAWFLDFSVYAVILVSGLSLVRGFGW